jgi:hypothetical protein
MTYAPSNDLPNFVIAGAPRSGTSAVFTYLANHPQVAAPSVKELQYFVDRESVLFNPRANYLVNGLDGYRRYFTDGHHKKPRALITFEATPGYMYQSVAVDALPRLSSSPRFLFLLRKPSDQLYSSYLYSLHQAANLPRSVSFREFVFGSSRTTSSTNEFHRCALAFVEYAPFLCRWRAVCGSDRMRVTRYEDLRLDSRGYMRDLARWLGIDADFYNSTEFPVVNASGITRSRRLNVLARHFPLPTTRAVRRVGRPLYRLVNQLNTHESADRSNDAEEVISRIDDLMQPACHRLVDEFGMPPW